MALPDDPTYLVATGITIHPVLTETEARAELAGTAGELALDIFREASDAHWDAHQGDQVVPRHLRGNDGEHHRAEPEPLVVVAPTLGEGAKGVQLAEAGIQSWRERRWVDLTELE